MINDKFIHTEQTRKRAENRYAILRALQSVRPMKRTELADYCGIRKSSVTSLIDELLENKWVRLEDPERPRSPLMMNENSLYSLSASLDENNIIIGKIDLSGSVVKLQEYNSENMKSRDDYLAELKKVLNENISSKSDLLGIAVSVPGIVDSAAGICISSINLPDFTNIPLADILKSEFKCHVVVENDIQSSLYSSLFLDKRIKQLNNAIYLDMTSGIGASILVHGMPLSGSFGAAGEIGHLKAGSESRLCRCGQKDCLETYSSIPAICRSINEKFDFDIHTSKEIVNKAAENPEIKEILKDAAKYIAKPLSSILAALDPEVVILGNQSRSFYELIVPYLREYLEKRLNGPASKTLKIEIAKEYSSLRGAAAYLMDLQFSAIN